MIVPILKIIGIVLLVILMIIIFILTLVLFVPIRYRFSGSRYDMWEGTVCVRWTPIFLKIEAFFKENHLRYTIKLFGGVVMTNTGVRLSWIGRRFFSFEEETDTVEENVKRNVLHQKSENRDNPLENRNIKDANYNTNIKEQGEQSAYSDNKMEKQSIFEKIQKRIEEWKRKWNHLKMKLREISHKKDALLRVYHSKRFEVVRQDLKIYIKEIFRILKPRQLEGYVHFGMEDPALTGKILGGLAVLLPLYQGFLDIRPDFEKKCFDGSLKGNGKIYIFSIVKLALKVILNKNLIKVTKKVQTIIEA